MTPQEAQNQLDELKKVAEQLQYTIPQNWLDDPLANANEITEAFVKWDDELKEIKKDLSGLNSLLKANLQDLTKSNIQLNQARKASRELASISQSLMNDKRNITSLDTKQIERLKQQTKISNDLLQQSIDSTEMNKVGMELERAAAEDNLRLGRELLNITEERLQLENKIIEKMGLAPSIAEGLSKTLNKIGFSGLANQLKLDDAVAKTKEFVKANDGNVSSFATLKNFSSNVASNLGGMLTKANLLQAGIGLLIEAMIGVDERAGQTAKTFGTSYDEALKINSELTNIAASQSNIFVTTKALVEAQNNLNTAIGTSAELSSDTLINYTEITKQAGYSVETATTLFKLRQTSGKTEKDLTQTYLGQVKALNLQNSLSVNGKALLNDISNISKGLLATYSKNPEKLAQAAFEAKKLGSSLKEVEGISNSLLDIESSIGAEFDAEVMTGKQLNLERARYYALTNDLAGVAKEINAQGIDMNFWMKENALQQSQLASAFGLTKDQMGEMVMEASTLQKIGMKDNEENRKKLEYLKAHGGNLEAINELGKEEYERQLKSTTVQERFAQSIEKLKEIFVGLVDPLMPILDLFVDLLGVVGSIVKLINPLIRGINQVVSLIPSVMNMFKGDFSFTPTFEAQQKVHESIENDWGISKKKEIPKTQDGVAPSSKVHESIENDWGISKKKEIQKTQDGMAPSSKGPFTITDSYGATAITTEGDGVVVSPNINKENKPTITTSNNSNNNSGISVLASSLNGKMDQMIGRLDNLIVAVNKGMVVNLDGIKVSEGLSVPMAISNRRI